MGIENIILLLFCLFFLINKLKGSMDFKGL